MAMDLAAKKKCFFLSVIGENGSQERATADKVFKHLVKKALGDLDVLRADDDKNPGAITPRIISSIMEADLIIADLSGLNANVFYELAIAHGYNKPTVHIQRATEKPPFDVKDMRIVRYDISDPDELEAAQRKLQEYAGFALSSPDAVETPLMSARRFLSVQSSQDPVAESNVQVIDAIESLRAEVRRALRRRGSRAAAPAPSSTSADVLSLKTIVARIVEGSRAELSDFNEVVTASTSSNFDDWVDYMLLRVSDGSLDRDERRRVAFDDQIFGPPETDHEGVELF